MERLTIDTKILFCDISQCRETPGGSFCEDGYCDQRRCYERLREYERKGLAPEDVPTGLELAEVYSAIRLLKQYEAIGTIDDLTALVKARDDGRVVVLPCKVGDTVYTQNHHGRIVDGIVESIHQNHVAVTSGRWVVKVYYPEYNGTTESGILAEFLPKEVHYGLLNFGKSVFLTRAEAEAVLKGETDA